MTVPIHDAEIGKILHEVEGINGAQIPILRLIAGMVLINPALLPYLAFFRIDRSRWLVFAEFA